MGSWRGDLFDVVLQSCGYNIYEFRKEYPRTGLYTNEYSRRDFEILWEGIEHLCPYWDDTDWPSSNLGCDKINEGDYQPFVCTCIMAPCAAVKRDDYYINNSDDGENCQYCSKGEDIRSKHENSEIIDYLADHTGFEDYEIQDFDSQALYEPFSNNATWEFDPSDSMMDCV